MAKDQQISLRFEAHAVGRAEALLSALRGATDFRSLNLSRADVLRMALLEGLSVLETRYMDGEPHESL